MKYIVYVSLFFAIAMVRSQEPSMSPGASPEVDDPMPRPTIPKLYLSTAGMGLPKTTPITPFKQMEICPSDYPTGFTIQCVSMNTMFATFYINAKMYRQEMYKPFYMEGNLKGKIHPFTGLDTKKKLRVGCRVPTRKPVWVDLVKSC